jgi:hypothetical protein
MELRGFPECRETGYYLHVDIPIVLLFIKMKKYLTRNILFLFWFLGFGSGSSIYGNFVQALL